MIAKTPTGIAGLDKQLGGTFQGRPMLVTGRRNAGKTIFGLQFINQGIALDERGLMLSMRPAKDLALYARSIGLNVDAVVDAGNLFLLEYSDVIPGRDREENIALPPEGFAQLIEIISSEYIRRVVIDTVIPWVVMVNRPHLAEHIFSFVRAFERLGVTTLFTCSNPVSQAAQNAHKILESNVPVAITLSYNSGTDERLIVVDKCIGDAKQTHPIPYVIEQGSGIVCPAVSSTTHAPAAAAPAPAYTPEQPPPAPQPHPQPPPTTTPPSTPAVNPFSTAMQNSRPDHTAPMWAPLQPAPKNAAPTSSPKPNFADVVFNKNGHT